MKRSLLALTVVIGAGCQSVPDRAVAVSPSPAELPVATAAALITSSPTPAATLRVSPAPSAARALSDAMVSSDDRSRLIFHVSGERRQRAMAWTDGSNGVLPGESPAATPWALSSPDGKRYVLNGKIYDRDGRVSGTLPWRVASLPTWSPDGTVLCAALPDVPMAGAPTRLQVQSVVPGEPVRVVATGFGRYGDNAVYPVLACDPLTDRVIVASFGQGLFAGALWIFRLSTGALVHAEALGTNAIGSWVTASADATLLAHSVRTAMNGPAATTVRAAERPSALQTLPDFHGPRLLRRRLAAHRPHRRERCRDRRLADKPAGLDRDRHQLRWQFPRTSRYTLRGRTRLRRRRRGAGRGVRRER